MRNGISWLWSREFHFGNFPKAVQKCLSVLKFGSEAEQNSANSANVWRTLLSGSDRESSLQRSACSRHSFGSPAIPLPLDHESPRPNFSTQELKSLCPRSAMRGVRSNWDREASGLRDEIDRKSQLE